jgi:hypothetical protein
MNAPETGTVLLLGINGEAWQFARNAAESASDLTMSSRPR